MADDLDAELAALEDEADFTDEPEQEQEESGVADEGQAEEAPKAEPKSEADPLPPEEIKKRNADLQAALREERRRRQEIERTYEERWQAIQSKITPQQPQQTPQNALEDIDAEADPITALKKLAGVVQGYQKAEQQTLEQRRQQEFEQQQEQILINTIKEDTEEFSQSFPDYRDAEQHFLRARFAMLTAAGLDSETANNAIKWEVMQLSARALQSQRSPAKAIYEAAKAIGFGYVAPQQKAAEQVDRIAAGTKTGSKQNGVSAGNSGAMSYKQLASLSGAAFDKAFDKFMRG